MAWKLKTIVATDAEKSFFKEFFKELMCKGPHDIKIDFLCEMITAAMNGFPYYIYDRHLGIADPKLMAMDMEHTVSLCKLFGLKCEIIEDTGEIVISWDDYSMCLEMEEMMYDFNRKNAE